MTGLVMLMVAMAVTLALAATPRFDLEVPPGIPAGAVAVFPLPPELGTDAASLAMTDARGRPVPFRVEPPPPGAPDLEFTGTILDTFKEAGRRTTWVVDLGAIRVFDRVEPRDHLGDRLVKPVKVDIARSLGDWSTVMTGVVFEPGEYSWKGGDVIRLPRPVTARWIRITMDDRTLKPYEMDTVAAIRSGEAQGFRCEIPVRLAMRRVIPHVSHGWRFSDRPEATFDRIRIGFSDRQFDRKVWAWEMVPRSDPRASALRAREAMTFQPDIRVGEGPEPDDVAMPLGESRLFRMSVTGPAAAADYLTLMVSAPGSGTVWLGMDNDDLPLPKSFQASVSCVVPRIVFRADRGRVSLRGISVSGAARVEALTPTIDELEIPAERR